MELRWWSLAHLIGGYTRVADWRQLFVRRFSHWLITFRCNRKTLASEAKTIKYTHWLLAGWVSRPWLCWHPWWLWTSLHVLSSRAASTGWLLWLHRLWRSKQHHISNNSHPLAFSSSLFVSSYTFTVHSSDLVLIILYWCFHLIWTSWEHLVAWGASMLTLWINMATVSQGIVCYISAWNSWESSMVLNLDETPLCSLLVSTKWTTSTELSTRANEFGQILLRLRSILCRRSHFLNRHWLYIRSVLGLAYSKLVFKQLLRKFFNSIVEIFESLVWIFTRLCFLFLATQRVQPLKATKILVLILFILRLMISHYLQIFLFL